MASINNVDIGYSNYSTIKEHQLFEEKKSQSLSADYKVSLIAIKTI